jgi:hypothetical protein
MAVSRQLDAEQPNFRIARYPEVSRPIPYLARPKESIVDLVSAGDVGTVRHTLGALKA